MNLKELLLYRTYSKDDEELHILDLAIIGKLGAIADRLRAINIGII